MKYTRPIAATLLLLASWGSFASRNAHAEPVMAGPCRASDASTVAHLHYLRSVANSSSTQAATWRSGTHVPYVADTTAGVFADPEFTTCAQALAAYITAAKLSDAPVTEVEVLRADTVLVVSHPAVRSGEFVARYVFDPSFRFLGMYLK